MYKIQSLHNKLKNIGIDVTFEANYPWIYLSTVNGKQVTERFGGNHGFTAFMHNQHTVWSDRKHVFEKIRSML
jgi:hypothetical protein